IPLRLGPSSLCCSHVRRLLVKCRRADRPGLPPPLVQTPRNCPAVDRYAVARTEQQDAPIEIGTRERRLAREPWQTKRPPEGGLGKSMLDVLDGVERHPVLSICHEAQPGEAQDHHSPGGGLGDTRSNFSNQQRAGLIHQGWRKSIKEVSEFQARAGK